MEIRLFLDSKEVPRLPRKGSGPAESCTAEMFYMGSDGKPEEKRAQPLSFPFPSATLSV